ncbi:hypothetical protein PoB_007546000 [Plakobranchus ocellatus]|uniref:Uncharacterized protein n=1 Tax=Plakobranchus ocellatus TaxID=259542 RepID=A0AAV4DXP7_9GAST|nr:hypothetical protein PoB_007546000 [Plakobranchus ocellatus]
MTLIIEAVLSYNCDISKINLRKGEEEKCSRRSSRSDGGVGNGGGGDKAISRVERAALLQAANHSKPKQSKKKSFCIIRKLNLEARMAWLLEVFAVKEAIKDERRPTAAEI